LGKGEGEAEEVRLCRCVFCLVLEYEERGAKKKGVVALCWKEERLARETFECC
jgi:hypothetical protein